jgi:phage baseplate assembly protein W
MALKPITGKDFAKSRSFKDVPVGFTKNPFTKDITSVKNDSAIKQSVRNIILTAPGEKPFQPNFGSRVSQLLFEPLDPFLIDTIQSEILNTLTQHEPRIQITRLECKPDYDDNSITVDLEYQIIGLPVIENISLVLQRP